MIVGGVVSVTVTVSLHTTGAVQLSQVTVEVIVYEPQPPACTLTDVPVFEPMMVPSPETDQRMDWLVHVPLSVTVWLLVVPHSTEVGPETSHVGQGKLISAPLI